MESDPSSYPELNFLNEFAEIAKSRNRLPHWRPDRAEYFVTYRLNDSIPDGLMKRWREQRKQWCRNHPLPWSPETEADYHRLFSSTIDRHLDDGHGCCLLREPANAEVVAGAFRHYDQHHYLPTPGWSCRTMCMFWRVPVRRIHYLGSWRVGRDSPGRASTREPASPALSGRKIILIV